MRDPICKNLFEKLEVLKKKLNQYNGVLISSPYPNNDIVNNLKELRKAFRIAFADFRSKIWWLQDGARQEYLSRDYSGAIYKLDKKRCELQIGDWLMEVGDEIYTTSKIRRYKDEYNEGNLSMDRNYYPSENIACRVIGFTEDLKYIYIDVGNISPTLYIAKVANVAKFFSPQRIYNKF